MIWTRFHLAHTQPSVTGVNGLPGRTYNSSPTSIRRLQRKLTRQGVCLPGTNIFGFYGIGSRRNRGFGRSPIPNLEHRFHTKFVNDHEGKISSRVVENTGLENEYCIKKGRKKKYITTIIHFVCYLLMGSVQVFNRELKAKSYCKILFECVIRYLLFQNIKIDSKHLLASFWNE